MLVLWKVMSQFYFKQRSNSESRPIKLGNGMEAIPVPVKCTLIGDSTVGKTSLLISYTTGTFCTQYVPTIFDSYQKVMVCDGVAVDLELCDTAGIEDLKKFRSFAYFETDVFIICFSIVSPKTLTSVINKWIPEIKEHWTNKPFVLVGTKSDLRTNFEVLKDLMETNEKPIERQMAQRLATKYGAIKYIECSSATKLGVHQTFDEAIRKALDIHFGPMVKPREKCVSCAIS